MPKPYSQELRDRVIAAVEKGEMSRRAAARRYQISESVAIKWLERLKRDGSREPVGHGGHRASKLMPHREFLEAAWAEKSDITLICRWANSGILWVLICGRRLSR
jgi:putative transposase